MARAGGGGNNNNNEGGRAEASTNHRHTALPAARRQANAKPSA
jgi:hypothetical protein